MRSCEDETRRALRNSLRREARADHDGWTREVLGEGAAGQHDRALLRSRLRLRLAERSLEAHQTLSVERIEPTLEPGERCARNSRLDGEDFKGKTYPQAA